MDQLVEELHLRLLLRPRGAEDLRPHPLIPPSLFKSRNFTVVNISTLLIYGALYVVFYNLALFQQGTLGYDAAAAGLSGLPGSILLTVLSSRIGRLAGRYGPRWFMVIGPLIMAGGVLMSAPLLVLYFVAQRWIVAGLSAGAVKG